MVSLVFDANAFPVSDDSNINLTFGRSKSEFRWTDKRSMSFRDFAAMLAHADVGNKDGSCYTPAVFAGSARRMDQATRIDIAVLDADCGHTFEEICKTVSKRNWLAVIHSTHSHLSDTTDIAATACDKWVAEHPGEGVHGYMLAKKGYLPAVLTGADVVDEKTVGETRIYTVRHQPCPKFRIILPLQEPWVADDFPSQAVANAAWRERIGALAFALGLFHDQSCVDTSRLFYLPRLRSAQSEYRHITLDGEDCPIWTLPDAVRATPATTLPLLTAADTPGPVLVRPDHITYQHSDGTWIDLTSWAAGHANRFEILTALRARAPGVLASRRSGVKQHIACPCADDHITGGADKTGTFVVNSSQNAAAQMPGVNGFIIHCSHNGCARRDRLGFLHALLRDNALSISDLTNPDFLTADIPQIDASALLSSSKEKPSNIPPELYENLPSVMHEIHNYICATGTKSQPALNLGATLAFMASAIGRKVQLQHWAVRPNIYVIGIAYSGAGKERPLSAIKQIAQSAGLFNKLIGVEEVASDAGIISSVMKQPNQIMLLDEVSFLLSAANNHNAGAHMANVISTLMKLYSSSHTRFKSKSYADIEKIQTIDQPCVSLYGCSTPKGLFSALSSKDITSGLLSRVVLFDAGENDPRGAPPQTLPVPAMVIDWLRAWDKVPLTSNPLLRDGGDAVIDPMTVLMTQDAMEIANAFEEEMHSAKIAARDRGMDALYVRARENALKFALIRACSPPAIKTDTGLVIDESNLLVDATTMQWAVALSRATVEAMDRSAKDQIVDTAFELKVRNFRDMVRKAGSEGITFREMGRTSSGRLPQREREDVIRLLRESGDIFFANDATPGKRGRKREAYVHKDFVREEVE